MKMRNLQRHLKRWLWRGGIDVVRFNPSTHPLARRAKLLQNYQISLVLDVGANTGQYATELRELGYQGRIVSFEPLQSAYAQLSAAAQSDPHWETRHHALGADEDEREIHIAANSQSSSFLGALPLLLKSYPESKYIASEKVKIRPLNAVFDEVARPDDRVWLKIDTQGYEKAVIEGAENVLPRITAIQAEVSLHQLYEGEATLAEFIPFMETKGFSLVGLETYQGDAVTSHLLQVDCIFHRST